MKYNKISRTVISVILVILIFSLSVFSAFAVAKKINITSGKVNTTKMNTSSNRKVTMRGIDVSRYNGVIDWAKSKRVWILQLYS